jgi:hypothetical protein
LARALILNANFGGFSMEFLNSGFVWWGPLAGVGGAAVVALFCAIVVAGRD